LQRAQDSSTVLSIARAIEHSVAENIRHGGLFIIFKPTCEDGSTGVGSNIPARCFSPISRLCSQVASVILAAFFRRSRLQHLQSRGTLERCDAPNDKTTRRRCWSRHLGLRHGHRSMRHLPRGSLCQATSRGRSSTWTTPNFRSCWRQLPSRSIAAIKALPRTKPLRLRRPGRHHSANLRRSAIRRPEGSTNFRKEQQISFGRRSGQGSSQRPLPARFEYPSPW